MTTYATCIFCNRNDSKPSREDVLAKWIAREFPDGRFRIKDVTNAREFGAVKNMGIISKAPCQRCNNEWMSRLENRVQPILTPMMQGLSVALNPADQLAIARWLIKTAVMHDLRTGRTGNSYFKPHECAALMTSISVPPDTLMFLASYRGTLDASAQWAGLEPDPDRLPEAKHTLREIEAYITTFTIKHLALQVFSFRRSEHLSVRNLEVEIPTDWSTAEFQIWPVANKTPIQWPPPFFMDDEFLALYESRFDDMSILGQFGS